MEGIDINIDKVGGSKDIALFRIRGYVDTSTAPELQRQLTNEIQEGLSQFVIDLGAVQYVSSAGWGVFVGEIRNLRERGGDLKLTQMPPEVFEVFDMLEFNRILTCYDSLEEAVDDFDYCRGIDFQSLNNISIGSKTYNESLTEVRVSERIDKVEPVTTSQELQSFPHESEYSNKKGLTNADLPLTEKIKKLILEDPRMGAWTIKRTLYTPRFSYTKLSYFKIRSLLKKLSLDTRGKRCRYFRSR
jgi:anti-sigma B factor antagonist